MDWVSEHHSALRRLAKRKRDERVAEPNEGQTQDTCRAEYASPANISPFRLQHCHVTKRLAPARHRT